jgi:hypothetical protein
VMGGFFHPCELGGVPVPHSVDYNLNSDPQAAVAALSTPIPTTYVPADVTMRSYCWRTHPARRSAPTRYSGAGQPGPVWTPIQVGLRDRETARPRPRRHPHDRWPSPRSSTGGCHHQVLPPPWPWPAASSARLSTVAGRDVEIVTRRRRRISRSTF